MTTAGWGFQAEWTLGTDRVDELVRELDSGAVFVVEHRIYQGAGNSRTFLCETSAQLRTFLQRETQPGDSVHFWRLADCCTNDNIARAGLIPDKEGRTPIRPAY